MSLEYVPSSNPLHISASRPAREGAFEPTCSHHICSTCQVRKETGTVNVLVNNAGIVRGKVTPGLRFRVYGFLCSVFTVRVSELIGRGFRAEDFLVEV